MTQFVMSLTSHTITAIRCGHLSQNKPCTLEKVKRLEKLERMRGPRLQTQASKMSDRSVSLMSEVNRNEIMDTFDRTWHDIDRVQSRFCSLLETRQSSLKNSSFLQPACGFAWVKLITIYDWSHVKTEISYTALFLVRVPNRVLQWSSIPPSRPEFSLNPVIPTVSTG